MTNGLPPRWERWRRAGIVFAAVAAVLPPSTRWLAWGEDGVVAVHRVNLNGPGFEASDGGRWEAESAVAGLSADGMSRFENQSVLLDGGLEDALARMVRSSVWSGDGRNRLVWGGLEPGVWSVALWVWEDNAAQRYDVVANGRVVAEGIDSGPGGSWARLGPWTVEVGAEGMLVLEGRGGHANWSGIEATRGGDLGPAPVGDRLAAPVPDPPAPPTDAQQHFESAVAPILARHCAECHNPSELKGELDLTTADGALEVIVPGDPHGSELWKLVAADEMPEKRPPLSDAEKETVRAWIASGAVWGRGPLNPFLASTDRRAGYDWWSLQPVTRPELPVVRNAGWPRGDIDRFILARLEAQGLGPAPEADRATLIRRASFDLTGLPPTPEEVAAFVSDPAPDAYGRLVDRLLASPAHGERWARHWLDVIRFGETQGFERNRIRPNAWRFRDWVIGALNDDLPYDDFVRMQIAGDVLHPGDLDAVLATGFLVCGTWDQVGHREGSAAMQKVAREEHVEDLVAGVSHSILALTVNCARCHDHKFDPVSQREYFQFAALLRGVEQDNDERGGIRATAPVEERLRELGERIAATKAGLVEDVLRAGGGEAPSPGNPAESAGPDMIGSWDFEHAAETPGGPAVFGPPIVASDPAPWISTAPAAEAAAAINAAGEATIEAWVTPANAEQTGPARIFTFSRDSGARNFTLGQDGGRWLVRFRTDRSDPNGQPALAGGRVTTALTHLAYTCDRHGRARLFVDGAIVAENSDAGRPANWDGSHFLAFGDEVTGDRRWEGTLHSASLHARALGEEEIALHVAAGPRGLRPGPGFDAIRDRLTADQRRALEQLEDEWERVRSAARPAHRGFDGTAHVVIPRQPEPARIFARGDVTRPGEVVSPAGLAALQGLLPDFGLTPDAPEAERRQRLADWLTSPDNPLTARVIVNRVWHYHFGTGIVDTPSDFGFGGGRPSHPELLDHLAATFIEDGWSLKNLHRRIVTSAAYRQSSNHPNPVASARDAEARLLWRMSPRRLEGEAVRDAMLAAAGILNRAMGGPSFRDVVTRREGQNDVFFEPADTVSAETSRRSVYRLWARSGNHPLLESLDCPDPSVMTPRRTRTITPIQSLSLLNNRFVEHCAAALAERARRETGDDPAAQVERAWLLAVQRPPSPREAEAAAAFVARHGLDQFCIVLFNTNAFLFVD